MTNRLPLYTDRALGLFPSLQTPLHAIPQVADLIVFQIRWDHQTYGSLTFDAPRLRPTYARLRSPRGGALPELIALTGTEAVPYEEVVETYSQTYGQMIRSRRYTRGRLTAFEPSTGEPRSDFARLLPDGGFCYAYATELNQATLYERNADDWFATRGSLTIAMNACALRDSPFDSWFPRLDLPQFAYLTESTPPFPAQSEVLASLTAPIPFVDGIHHIELGYPRVEYNTGRRLERDWVEIQGVAHLEASLWVGADQPFGMLADWHFPRPFHQVLVHALGDGVIPASDFSRSLILDFGGD